MSVPQVPSTTGAANGPIASAWAAIPTWGGIIILLGTLVGISAIGDPWAWVGFGTLILLLVGILVAWSQGATLTWE